MLELNHSHLTRQLDLIPVETLNKKVTIIGCGAIGSFLGLSLAKMGMERLSVWDFDEVSIENMSNQFYKISQLGQNKALALTTLVKEFTDVSIECNQRAFTPDDASGLSGIVVVAVDSMAVRRMVYEAIAAKGFNVEYIIDPRMGAEMYTQYTIKPFEERDTIMYAKVLHSDAEAVQERCTAKSTVYTATLGAGLIVKTIKNLLLKQPYPRNTQWSIVDSTNPMIMYAG